MTLSPTQRARIQGARTPGPAPVLDSVPLSGAAQGVLPRRYPHLGQRVQVGLRYASQIVTIEVNETTLRVYDHLIKSVPRTSRKEVARHKAYGHTTNRKTG